MLTESIHQPAVSDAAAPYRGGPGVPLRGAGNTPEGRARSAMNAVKHGLTGRTVVLPTEDMAAYRKFSEELVESFAPETPFERQLAQTVADTQWRLNRARSIEDGMFCVGSFGPAGDIDTENSQIHAALAASQVFKEDSKAFVNLTLYEQRLHRAQKQAFEQLQALQTGRKAEEQAALKEAKLIHKLHKMKGIPDCEPVGPYRREVGEHRKANGQQFVFSSAEIEAEIARDRRLEEAGIARAVDYNLKYYESRVARLAA